MTIFTNKQIIKEAKTCVSNVKKNQKLGISYRWGLYFGKLILNPKAKEFKKIEGIKDCPAPTGTEINKTISKDDYIKLARNYVAYCESKHEGVNRFPNFAAYGNYQIRPRLLCAFFAKIVVYYDEHGKLPSEMKINSGNNSKLHDYITSTGCSGMGQCTSYYCGPNSLQQCLYRLTGIHVDESTLAGWAGTTSSGTDHQGLETAVAKFNKKYNRKVKIVWKNFNDLGKTDAERWKALANYIKKGAVFIHLLYRLKWGHYEVPKTIGDILKILNSLGDKCTSTSYCGYIENRSKSDELAYIRGISKKSIAILTEE